MCSTKFSFIVYRWFSNAEPSSGSAAAQPPGHIRNSTSSSNIRFLVTGSSDVAPGIISTKYNAHSPTAAPAEPLPLSISVVRSHSIKY